MQILGNTLTEIATEKAGIIKTRGIVVTSAQSSEALLAIARIAREREARLVRVGALAGDPAQAEVDAGQEAGLDTGHPGAGTDPQAALRAPDRVHRLRRSGARSRTDDM